VRRDDSGAIAIIVALFAVVLFGFAALVVDVGNAADVKAQASTAADAGALAGARDLAAWANAHGPASDPLLEQAVEDAVKNAVKNTYPVTDAAWAACTDSPVPTGLTPLTTTPCIEYSVSDTQSTVRVRMPVRRVPSTFGGIFGASSISVSPLARASAGQDQPSPCQPCEPRLDDISMQPVSQATLPEEIRRWLPDPTDRTLVPAGSVDDASGCPTSPGYFDKDVIVTGKDCVLNPGLYLFDDSKLEVQDSLSSRTAPDGTGVTLIFYGQTQDVPLNVENSLSLTATPPGPLANLADPVPGNPIPGVAVVIDQFSPGIRAQRRFELGTSFDITGSVYALDGHTTWLTNTGDCVPLGNSCWIHDQTTNSVLAVTATGFADDPGIPTVRSEHPAALPPPRPEHLVE
jgi:hypothetical protein